jgi:hypothetical protein
MVITLFDCFKFWFFMNSFILIADLSSCGAVIIFYFKSGLSTGLKVAFFGVSSAITKLDFCGPWYLALSF